MKRIGLAGVVLLCMVGTIGAMALGFTRADGAKYDRRVVIVAKDMAFFVVDGDTISEPNPDLLLHPGQRVLIEFRNEDPGMRHDLVVEAWSFKTRILEPDEATELLLTVPLREGSVPYLCTLHAKMMRGQAIATPRPQPMGK